MPIDYVLIPGDDSTTLPMAYIAHRSIINKSWLSFKEEEAHSTCGSKSYTFSYLQKGLIGEIGEIYDLFKRVERGDWTTDSEIFQQALRKELGDVLWYSATLNKWFKSHKHINHRTKNQKLIMAALHIVNFFKAKDKIYLNNKVNDILDEMLLRAILFINFKDVIPLLLVIDYLAKLIQSNIVQIGEENHQKLLDRINRQVLFGVGSDR